MSLSSSAKTPVPSAKTAFVFRCHWLPFLSLVYIYVVPSFWSMSLWRKVASVFTQTEFCCTDMCWMFQTHIQCSLTEFVCECTVTECLNYGLIVSLAGFCCWHHIGPVKVNYWNMYICCQPLQQAVTCMETQTNTQMLFTQTIHRVPCVPQVVNSFSSAPFLSASAHFE